MSATAELAFCPHRAVLGVMNISYATDLWLGELERKGHSRRTVNTYRRTLDALASQHPSHKDVREVSAVDVRQFLDTYSRKATGGGKKAASTIAGDVSTVNSFFDWVTKEGIIERNPTRRNGDRILARPVKPNAEDNDNVVTVSSEDVRRLIFAAERGGEWNERLAIAVLCYLGPRRHACAQARLEDYDQVGRTLTFREKGAKTISKPVPDRLAELIDRAINAGIYIGPHDYLIPSNAAQRRPGERDDRIIYRLVKQVAKRAGVTTHVHALRAAFAVFFLEQRPDEVIGLQKLLGHARLDATLIYLRRLNRRLAMDSVRSLDWSLEVPANSEESLEAFRGTEKEGFEPSFEPMSLLKRDGSQNEGSAPRTRQR